MADMQTGGRHIGQLIRRCLVQFISSRYALIAGGQLLNLWKIISLLVEESTLMADSSFYDFSLQLNQPANNFMNNLFNSLNHD